MAHDPDIYHEPFLFNPERFLGEGHPTRERSYSVSDAGAYDFRGMSPSNAYWDRICPGKEFADSTLFITIAMAVAVFNISKAKDDRGTDIEPRREYVPGTIRCVPMSLLLLVLPSGLSG